MPNASRILHSLSSQPGYTLMRGAARFSAARRLVATTRRAVGGRKAADYLADCDARIAQTAFPAVDRIAFVRALRTDGIAFGLTVPAAVVSAIHDYARHAACYADRVPAHGFTLDRRNEAEQALGKPILLAQYLNTAQECTAIGGLADDPMLQAIACDYLGSVPTFVGANLWWTFPVAASEADRDRHAHLFHRDVDDFRFFKFFFYLTDVDAGDGAHVCVAGSHLRPPHSGLLDRWNIRRYGDDEVAARYPPGHIHEILGPAGTGFAENTLCVHKGLTPTRSARLLLQLQYALFDYGAMHDRVDPARLGRIA
ncbi:MAG: hypothetical protein OJF60_000837 [Burkholderiaceae bacterium]|jgi:hypothetical protein|nr:MAG: hypothetical protein OJF60_000837 [Burkholderiaceae bacterium]